MVAHGQRVRITVRGKAVADLVPVERANTGSAEDDAILARVTRLARGWYEVGDVRAVRDRAERLLGNHPLRAADALRIAAARTCFERRTKGRQLVTLDDNLASAADAEGFTVVQAGG